MPCNSEGCRLRSARIILPMVSRIPTVFGFMSLSTTSSAIVRLVTRIGAILLLPFVPFVVILCHTLETCKSSHLETLSSVIDTLALFPTNLPKPYKVQIMISKAMYEVVCDYVTSRQSSLSVDYQVDPDAARFYGSMQTGDLSATT